MVEYCNKTALGHVAKTKTMSTFKDIDCMKGLKYFYRSDRLTCHARQENCSVNFPFLAGSQIDGFLVRAMRAPREVLPLKKPCFSR